MPQTSFNFRCIDLFAGVGGFSCAAESLGGSVVWAGNHWPEAVKAHQQNHPDTMHACVDLRLVDWTTLPASDMLLASPACQGHSRARGADKPHHDALRATAWVVVEALEKLGSRGFVVENVPEFAKWQLFPVWLEALKRLGYRTSYTVIDAADCGVAQHRKRFFLIGAKNRVRLPALLAHEDRYVPVSRALDLETLGAPVTSRLNARTQHQIQCGIAEHRGQPFLVPYYGSQRRNGSTRSVARPCGTVTTVERYGLWNAGHYRMLTVQEYRRIMGFSDSLVLPESRADAIKMLGNAVCPPAAAYAIRCLLASM